MQNQVKLRQGMHGKERDTHARFYLLPKYKVACFADEVGVVFKAW